MLNVDKEIETTQEAIVAEKKKIVDSKNAIRVAKKYLKMLVKIQDVTKGTPPKAKNLMKSPQRLLKPPTETSQAQTESFGK